MMRYKYVGSYGTRKGLSNLLRENGLSFEDRRVSEQRIAERRGVRTGAVTESRAISTPTVKLEFVGFYTSEAERDKLLRLNGLQLEMRIKV